MITPMVHKRVAAATLTFLLGGTLLVLCALARANSVHPMQYVPLRVDVCFDAQCATAVVARLDATTNQVRVAIYALTEPRIFAALTNAAGRGVDVRIIADVGEAKTTTSLIPKLQNLLGVARVKKATGRSGGKYGLLHDKFAVLDGAVSLTGSFNWTANATRNNWENLVVIQDPVSASEFLNEFATIWQKGTP